MESGDVIELEGKRLMLGRRNRELRVFQTFTSDGVRSEVADDYDKTNPEICKIVCNPSKDWPYVSPKQKNIKILTLALPMRQGLKLECMIDWIPGNPGREAGTIYLNPALRLGFGDILLIYYEGGHVMRVTIPKAYGTIRQRADRLAEKPKEEKAACARILLDDD